MIRLHQYFVLPALLLGIFLLFLLSSAGCQPAPVEGPVQSPTLTAPGVESSDSQVADTVIDVTDTAEQVLDSPSDAPLQDNMSPAGAADTVTLTFWTVEDVSPDAPGEAGKIFEDGLKAFEENHPGTTVSVVLKNASGKGSVLDYLKTATQVAPSVLPDVVVLNTTDMAEASRTGILVPLDELIPAELSEDLLPTARTAGIVDERLVGVPFEMDVEHIVYNLNKIPAPPVDWTNVLTGPTTYMFPMKGHNGLVNDAFLVQYLALGGQFLDEEEKPFINEQRLLAVLKYYQEGSEAGVFPNGSLLASTVEDVWPAYVSAQTGIANVTSHLYLRERDTLQTTSYAAVPTRDGNTLTVGRGRVLAITTRDPVQQMAAVRLIVWMLEPSNAVAWSQTAYHLPTRYTTFGRLIAEDPYWAFAQQQFEAAVPAPSFSGYDQIGRVLQQAVTDVLTGEDTPEDAAAAAFDAIPR
jgi:ABC-type glycerol-3-phosphate transport system substrate-binding protein